MPSFDAPPLRPQPRVHVGPLRHVQQVGDAPQQVALVRGQVAEVQVPAGIVKFRIEEITV